MKTTTVKPKENLPPPQVVLICAGDFMQFSQHARHNAALNRKYVYANEPSRVLGLEPTGCLVIGTFWKRPDARDILDNIQRRYPDLLKKHE